MCGITGILGAKRDAQIDHQLLKRMTDRLSHRGPDGDGIHIEKGVGLGHRRLAIIDLAGGAQPMATEDNALVLTYNGEIYNYKEIRKKLIAQGVEFRTDSDSEVLLKAYGVWGAGCLEHLRGMFAFAIWDSREQALFLARDRMGIKPLHYATLRDGSFAFASEIKALMQADGLSREIRMDALEDYLALSYVPDPKTIFSSVHKLQPGHYMVVRHGEQPKITRYWQPPLTGERTVVQTDDLLARLEEATRIRMIADVPLGAFLSGGLDSSTVVMLMSGLSDQPVKTCSIGMVDQRQDESSFAEQVATKFQTDHRSRLMSSEEDSLLNIMTECFDEPFADNSALPTYRVCGLARENVTVALSGDGGDEIFGGYRRYQFFVAEQKVRNLLPFSARQAIFGPIARAYPKADWAPRFLRAKSTFESLAMSGPEAYFHGVARGVDRDRIPLTSDAYRKALNGYHPKDRFEELADEVKGAHPLTMVQYIDMNTYLPGCILTKVDRTSMAQSLEVRVPILDHKFMEWAGTLHPDVCLEGRIGKVPMRKAVRGRLPDDVLDRKKQGFSIPVGEWMRKEWRAKTIALSDSEVLLDSGLFDRKGLRKMVDDHLSEVRNHADILWSMVVLEKQLSSYASSRLEPKT